MPGLSAEFFTTLARIQDAVPEPEAFDFAATYLAGGGFSRLTLDYLDPDAEAVGGPDQEVWIGRLYDSRQRVLGNDAYEVAFHMCPADHGLLRRIAVGDRRPFIFGGMDSAIWGGEPESDSADMTWDLVRTGEPNSSSVWVVPLMLPISRHVPTAYAALHRDRGQDEQKNMHQQNGVDAMIMAYALAPALSKAVLVRREAGKQLTSRELEVLQHIAGGLRPAQIADRLSISPHTIEFHLRSVRSKLNAPTLAHAVSQAYRSYQISV
ncbi:MAG: helix-turn-helix transcriptional regulator [Pseudomonadota bacterium]